MPDLDSSEQALRHLAQAEREAASVPDVPFALRAGDIDVIYCYGFGFPRHRGGPMYHADSIGLSTVLRRVEDYRRQFGDYWRPAPLLARLASEGRGFHDLPSPASPATAQPS